MRKRHSDSLNSEKLNLSSNMRLTEEVCKTDKPGQLLAPNISLHSAFPSGKSRPRRFCSKKMTYSLIWIVVFGVLSTLLMRSAFPIYLNVADEKFLEIRKCPACFGVCLCPAFLTGDIVPDNWSRLRATQLLNAKNVFFARFKERKVVLKKLGHDSRLEKLDQHLVHQTKNVSNPDLKSVSMAIRPYTHENVIIHHVHDLQGNKSRLLHRLKVFNTPAQNLDGENSNDASSYYQGSELLTCPSQRKFDFIENQFVKNNSGLYRLTCLYNLMTILLLNSEPLIFQSFSADDGWPFPVYYGACGRVIVEEYVGPNLAKWLPSASLKERIRTALSMLKIAIQFTEGVNGFRLYATDLSLFNVAVGVNGSLKIIDGENIVVVDLEKIREDRPENYDVPYASDDAACQELPSDPDCMSYSENDLCNRLYNDHNYYAVCRELFSPSDKFGLMRDLQNLVPDQFARISQLQDECYATSTPGMRERAAKKLVEVYSEILTSL